MLHFYFGASSYDDESLDVKWTLVGVCCPTPSTQQVRQGRGNLETDCSPVKAPVLARCTLVERKWRAVRGQGSDSETRPDLELKRRQKYTLFCINWYSFHINPAGRFRMKVFICKLKQYLYSCFVDTVYVNTRVQNCMTIFHAVNTRIPIVAYTTL